MRTVIDSTDLGLYRTGPKGDSGVPDGTTDGDILVWLDGAWTVLPIGDTEGQVLTIVSGVPTWVTPS